MRWIDAIFFVLAKEAKYVDAKYIYNEIIALNLKDSKKSNYSVVSRTISKHSNKFYSAAIKIEKKKSNLYYLDQVVFLQLIASFINSTALTNASQVGKVVGNYKVSKMKIPPLYSLTPDEIFYIYQVENKEEQQIFRLFLKSSINKDGKLALGMGQNVKINSKIVVSDKNSTRLSDKIFQIDKKEIENSSVPKLESTHFNPDRNFILKPEETFLKDLENLLPAKLTFNDPTLYDTSLKVVPFYKILCKQLAECKGIYSIEIQIPDIDTVFHCGEVKGCLPNIGINLYTNSGWKVDIGFPKNDWSTSKFFQLSAIAPFVGWGVFYFCVPNVLNSKGILQAESFDHHITFDRKLSKYNNNAEIKLLDYRQEVLLERDQQVKTTRSGFEVDFGHEFLLHEIGNREISNDRVIISKKFLLQPMEKEKQYEQMLSVDISDVKFNESTLKNDYLNFQLLKIVELSTKEIAEEDIVWKDPSKREVFLKNIFYKFCGITRDGTEVFFSKAIKLHFT